MVDLINENPNGKWEKIKFESNIKIYKKKVRTFNISCKYKNFLFLNFKY